MEKTIQQDRCRVAFKQSTKNKVTAEITLEVYNVDQDFVLKKARALMVDALKEAESMTKRIGGE